RLEHPYSAVIGRRTDDETWQGTSRWCGYGWRRGSRSRRTVARKLRRSTQRNVERRADPLEVASHVAPLGGVDVEGRVVPTLRLEDRPEKKRAPRGRVQYVLANSNQNSSVSCRN